jgi:hypothetical protein
MAIDLMKGSEMPHHVRHDMEAMHWVLVWFTFRYQNGDEIPTPPQRPLEKWVTSSVLNDVKNSFLHHHIEGHPTRPFSSLLVSWISPWNSLFRGGHNELVKYNFQCSDEKTKEVPTQIVFPHDSVFFDDTSMWTAFWNVLNPDNHIDFDNVCNSTWSGFLPN